MKKSITRTAVLFKRKELRGEVSSENVLKYLQRAGYAVFFYTEEKNKLLLSQYGLYEFSQTATAFTYANNENRFVFVNDRSTSEQKLYSLLHEAGHIFLGHLIGNPCLKNDRKTESESEAFVHAVMSLKNAWNCSIVILAILTLIIAILCILPYKWNSSQDSDNNEIYVTPPTYTNSSEQKVNIVYVTPSGHKFHRADCRYTKDKDCTTLTREEAEKRYSPCSVCKP